MVKLSQKEKEALKEVISRLEESYHFNLNEFSFIYNGLKAFIVDVRERKSIIAPFTAYRKQLADYIIAWDLETDEGFRSPDQMTDYLNMCMQIIANMLDDTRMGSVEFYLDHIWKEFDTASNDTTSPLPMQNFIDNITSIITMIDYSLEVQLASISDEDKEESIINQVLKEIDPDLEMIGAIKISESGKIEKILIKKKDKPKKQTIDLSKIKSLNTKAI
jgi:hypothetical protein